MVEIAKIQLPCEISKLESFLHSVADQGHWHHGEAHIENNQIVIKHKKENSHEHKEG